MADEILAEDWRDLLRWETLRSGASDLVTASTRVSGAFGVLVDIARELDCVLC